MCSLGLPSVAGVTVALLHPSSSQLRPCLVFIVCHIYAVKNRANFICGRSLVVKCEQGIMADSLGGCDCMCVCMYVYIYIYIYTRILTYTIISFHNFERNVAVSFFFDIKANLMYEWNSIFFKLCSLRKADTLII